MFFLPEPIGELAKKSVHLAYEYIKMNWWTVFPLTMLKKKFQ